MNVIRKIYDQIPDTIPIPDSLRSRRVGVILLPLDEDEPHAGWGKIPIDELMGAWQGEPLTRPDQGEFDQQVL